MESNYRDGPTGHKKYCIHLSFFVAYSLCINLFLQVKQPEDENEDKKVFHIRVIHLHVMCMYCTYIRMFASLGYSLVILVFECIFSVWIFV